MVDLRSLSVTGVIDGKPVRVDWAVGQLEGLREHKEMVRNYALAHEGEMFELHPEGGAVPCGLDTYESAWATVQRAFDAVGDVDGPDPFAELGDEEDERDTTDMADRWTPSLHPRWPRGGPKGGKFMTKGEIAAAKKSGNKWMNPTPTAPSPPKVSNKKNAGRNPYTPGLRSVPSGAGPTRLKAGPPEQTRRALPVPLDPSSKGAITTNDPKEAARLLSEGKAVNLRQARHVSVLLDELAKMVAEAEAKGDKAPNFDLCRVTLRNTNLFCVESKGIPRIQMPQLKGVPEAGSVADRMKKDDKGEVDLTAKFLDHLRRGGFKTTDTEEHAAYLRASQNELNGVKVGGMVKWMRGGGDPNKGSRMLVSEDNYIVDGHHRWAATVALDTEDNRLGNDKQLPITRIDIDIIKLLREAVLFANAQGIPNAGFTKVPAVA